MTSITNISEIQELAIVLSARNHRPNLLTLSFLQCSGIVPEEWQLARQPISTNQVAQVSFSNGVSLSAQANRITFSESIGTKAQEDINIPQIARQYSQALPKIEYDSIGLNIRTFATAAEMPEGLSVQDYIANHLVAAGPWQNRGTAPLKASIQLVYTLEQGKLVVSVNEAQVQLPEGESMPVVMFSGSFNYPVGVNSPQERLESIDQSLNHWQRDLASFRDIIYTDFLKAAVPVAPPQELVTTTTP